MSTNWKLAQEIYEEFLTCRICLDSFKSPKSLTCLHVFCEQCIENHLQGEASYKKYSDYRDFTCPICRKRTPVPTGGVKKLPDNFLVANLGEIVGRQRPANANLSFCDICRTIQRKHREAASKCLDCNKLLCQTCVETHRDTKVTKHHSIFDVEIEKDVMCKEHKEEAVRFYCEPCETCICVMCTFADHRDHNVTDFSDSARRYQSVIRALLDKCKSNLTCLEKQLETVARSEQRLKEAEQSIHDVAIQYISEIRTREKQMVEELQRTYGKKAIELISGKGELQSQVEQLKTTCNLTEIVLSGKDIELLLLKKQLEDKLVALAALQPRETPRGLQKEVKFVPGQLNLGTLVDGECASAPASPLEATPPTPNRRKTCCAIFTYPAAASGSGVGLKPLTLDAAAGTSCTSVDAETMTVSVETEYFSAAADTDSSASSDRNAVLAGGTESGSAPQSNEDGASHHCANALDRRTSASQPMQTKIPAAQRVADADAPPTASSSQDAATPGPTPLMRRRERRRRAVLSPNYVDYSATISLDD